MNNLVTIKNNQVVVSSRQVAEHFGKRHTHTLDSIKSLISSAENSAHWYRYLQRVTGKGQLYFVNLFRKDFSL